MLNHNVMPSAVTYGFVAPESGDALRGVDVLLVAKNLTGEGPGKAAA